MPLEIRIPRLGWSMEEGLFSAWLKKNGERVKAGEPLYVLESEKAQQEVESLDDGVLHIPFDAPQPGDTVKVGQLLAYLLAEGEAPPANAPVLVAAAALATPQPVREQTIHRGDQTAPIADLGGARATPRARRAARELGVDWRTITGSGRSGRVRERDIRSAAQQSPRAASNIRRTIAERMVSSLQHTAPVTLNTTTDATALVQWREELKKSAPTESVASYNDAFIKLSAIALTRHPTLNARWEGDNLVPSPAIHIGLAVHLESGLVVPVIRNVEQLGLNEIASRSRQLVERAQTRRLFAEDLRGGTFTISNLGALGIDAFTPIIHYPECAILGLGRIRRQPVVIGEQIVARDILTLSLTFDHRALDGAPAAHFLQTLRALVESPQQYLRS
jgi:pyruvate dehydrogenase E2 component (dihydrolipoamide acetyltransferase)